MLAPTGVCASGFVVYFCFFFSSRRRHTRCLSDWSSDVCSSDLGVKVALGRDHVIGEMCDAIHRLTDQYRGGGRFVGAGIGVPGIIDMETGMMRKSANLPGWSDYPVRDEIERRLGARVFLENDANVAALGEKWLGAARDVDNMAMVTLGTGIGGAIILNGKIFYGMNGMAGEFGHVTIEPNG